MNAEPETFYRYFPLHRRDADWGLNVTCAGYVKIEPGSTYPPPGHPTGYDFAWEQGRVLREFQLHYIARGGGVFESESSGKKRIETGSVFLLFPGEWHRFHSDTKTGWDEYWVGFNGDTAKRLLRKGFISLTKPVLAPRGDHALLDYFTSIISEMRSERVGFAQIIAATTTLIIATIRAAVRPLKSTTTRTEAIIHRAKTILHQRLDRVVSLTALARELGVSSAWLRQQFRKHTGLPVLQYHLQVRIHAAMQRLAATDDSIKEIAAQCGFADAHYFSRIFRKMKGCTATEWRRRKV
ncbi:helix-turn-helix domain-containing protein [Prosthecobacter sp.]|jgi:AraC-like DNA-binding protein|uniref:AraC family transcriptional regulator n=1 Tax=Prosthecobacter sp. TaxID=1965333 RepID=UPI0037C6BA48